MKSIRVHPILLIALVAAFGLLSLAQGQRAQRIAVLTPQQAEILSHLSIVYLDDGQGGQAKTIRFTGVNVQVVNGLGATNGNPQNPEALDPPDVRVNGVGNIIIGYNEPGSFFGIDRTGSHNVVCGFRNNYSSVGSAVFGWENEASGIYSSVLGGERNTATALDSVVTGGAFNVASGSSSSVCGGTANSSAALSSHVCGGNGNVTSGTAAVVQGGHQNVASGSTSSVAGGALNIADGDYSSVSGGLSRSISSLNTGGNLSFDWSGGSLWQDF